MKIVGTFILTTVALLVLLHSDLTPWRIVTQDEWAEQNRQIAALAQQVSLLQRPGTEPAKQPTWITDPNYRSALERTTVIGVPERSKSREAGAR